MRENLISRSVPIYRPTPSKDDFEPEPELAKAEYQYILSVIRSLSLLIERNPTSFVNLNEETIRDNIFLQLNCHYEGAATSETFNGKGKTDILIRVGDRNIVIAECKFWPYFFAARTSLWQFTQLTVSWL